MLSLSKPINNNISFHVNLFILLLVIFLSSPSTAEETQNGQGEETDTPQNTQQVSLPFAVNNHVLLENVKHDSEISQSKLESINEGELLILIHQSKSNKKRGNILLLHSNGENANHQRLVRPLSIQLSKLGWNVYIPNIALEDFPKPKFRTARKTQTNQNKKELAKETNQQTENPETSKDNDENKTMTEESAANQQTNTMEENSNLNSKKHYFDSTAEYQTYIKNICEKISTDPDWTNQPRILVLAHSSSYWGLNCFTKDNLPIVFLNPQIPDGVKDDLQSLFSEQSSSFYVFYSEMAKNTKMASFAKALSSNQWHSKNQRYNQGILTKTNLNIEDISLAKRITGWTEKLRKKTN